MKIKINTISFLFSFLFISNAIIAQAVADKPTPYIEITGKAEMEVAFKSIDYNITI